VYVSDVLTHLCNSRKQNGATTYRRMGSEGKAKLLRSFSLPLHVIEKCSLHDLATSWDKGEPQSGAGSYLAETYPNVWTSRLFLGGKHIILPETGLTRPNS
jgi:hypothetical protein